MIDKGKKNLLGINIDIVDYDTAVAKIIDAAQNHQGMAVTALAVHGVMTGVLDGVQAARLNTLDLVVPDGQPVRWALNLLHNVGLHDRVYGPTLMLKVCEQAAKQELPVCLYGSRPEVLAALQKALCSRFPNLRVTGNYPSRFCRIGLEEKMQIVGQINASRAAILFVGLGCPRQEVWIYEHRGLMNIPMIAVGAAFDLLAGILPQAPPKMQQMGFEWAFRLLKEPKRLWRRYLLLNPQFIFLLLLQMSGLRKFNALPASELPHREELRYG